MSEKSLILASDAPLTRDGLAEQLHRFGVRPGMTLLVHSSLKSLGWVSGGPVAVIQALMDVLTEEGTLMMPTHSTDLSDPAEWMNPPVPADWVSTIRHSMPAFDPERTHTRCMGAIPELFRTWPDVLRSRHPLHSFAAWGKHRDALVKAHSYQNSMGEESPLGRLYELKGHVLLLGVGYECNSSYHLAEYRLPHPKTIQVGAPIQVAGKRKWCQFEDIELVDSDQYYGELGASMEKFMPVHRANIGLADCRLFAQQAAVDFAVDWFLEHIHHSTLGLRDDLFDRDSANCAR